MAFPGSDGFIFASRWWVDGVGVEDQEEFVAVHEAARVRAHADHDHAVVVDFADRGLRAGSPRCRPL